MAKKDTKSEGQPKSGGGIGKIILLVLLVLLLVVGAAGAAVYFTGGMERLLGAGAQAQGAEPAPAPQVRQPVQGPPKYLSLDPPFVVNFDDQGLLRYLQISVSVMARDQVFIDAVRDNAPHIRNNLILLFGGQDFQALGTTDGKEALRTQTLAEIQGILSEEIGLPGVEAVYFTNFIMQ